MTIGSLEDAQAVLFGQGRYLGEGCTRTAYLYNGVVYKIGIADYGDMVNSYEYEKACELRNSSSLPDSVRIPEFSLYVVENRKIVATQLIDGIPCSDYCPSPTDTCTCLIDDSYCLSREESHMLESISYDAPSEANTYYYDGYFYIVDLG